MTKNYGFLIEISFRSFIILSVALLSEASSAKQCIHTVLLLEETDNRLERQVELSDFIFVGEATWTEHTIVQHKGSEEWLKETSVIFSVSEAIKGDLPKEVIIEGVNSNECSCKYKFSAGVTYLVLGIGKETLKTAFCDLIKPIEHSQYKEIVETVRRK